MKDLPISGDTGLPWYDPEWPWNGPSVQRFLETGMNRGILETNVVDVDFELVIPVAVFAGADGDCWDDCTNQCILIRNASRWQVLTRPPKRSELLKWFDKDEVDYVWARQRPKPIIFDYGEEGNIRKWVMHDYRGVIRFEGDQTIRQVVDTLVGWGFVTSKYWPRLLETFPQFQQCETYLSEIGALWSDGSHPLHQSAATATNRKLLTAIGDTAVEPEHCIDIDNRTLIWFGERFFNIDPNPFKIIELLYVAFVKGHGPITLDAIRTKFPDIFTLASDSGKSNGLAEVFTKRVSLGNSRRRTKLGVWNIINNCGTKNSPAYELRRPKEIPG